MHSVAHPRNDLSFDEVRERYDYDPKTGEITGRKSGRRVGFQHSSGYRHIEIAGRHRKEHRVAWLLHYGAWPVGQIDHINGDKCDNRIENLRDVDGSVNQLNSGVSVRNNTGYRGVSLRPSGKFEARIRFRGKQVSLGYFSKVEDAHQAYERQRSALSLA